MYADLCERVDLHDDPPEGLIFRGAGPADTGWRIVDVWDTVEHWDAYFAESVRPALDAIVLEGGYNAIDRSVVTQWQLSSYSWGPGPLVDVARM
jgi:hypothetical protein